MKLKSLSILVVGVAIVVVSLGIGLRPSLEASHPHAVASLEDVVAETALLELGEITAVNGVCYPCPSVTCIHPCSPSDPGCACGWCAGQFICHNRN